MPIVVGVRFKKAGKVYYFDPAELAIAKGDHAIVETVRGVEYGEVVVGPKVIDEGELVSALKPIIKKADEADAKVYEANCIKEKAAFKTCEEKIAAHSLPMKLIDVEYTFDVNKIIFYFTAEGRIDFRELVKDLAAVFRTRIELRQIGVRDEAKMLGGIGGCGRPLCCASFLGDFEPVSIRMAKDQNLSLNPTKISGICGRLMCCLKYENHLYEHHDCGRCKGGEFIPKNGQRVMTGLGEGMVKNVDRRQRTVLVELSADNVISVGLDEVVEISMVKDEL
mgnify:CR=1 FL=1